MGQTGMRAISLVHFLSRLRRCALAVIRLRRWKVGSAWRVSRARRPSLGWRSRTRSGGCRISRRSCCTPRRRARALAEAGLTKDDVDGLFTAGISTLELGEYLGIEPKVTDTTAVGGSSFVIHIAHAATAIATGRCEVALVTHGESGRSRVGMPGYPASRAMRSAISSRRRSACRSPSARTRWPARATCTSTARPRSNWRRSPSRRASGRC